MGTCKQAFTRLRRREERMEEGSEVGRHGRGPIAMETMCVFYSVTWNLATGSDIGDLRGSGHRCLKSIPSTER